MGEGGMRERNERKWFSVDPLQLPSVRTWVSLQTENSQCHLNFGQIIVTSLEISFNYKRIPLVYKIIIIL